MSAPHTAGSGPVKSLVAPMVVPATVVAAGRSMGALQLSPFGVQVTPLPA